MFRRDRSACEAGAPCFGFFMSLLLWGMRNTPRVPEPEDDWFDPIRGEAENPVSDRGVMRGQ